MRLARVLGTVTLNPRLPSLKGGSLLLVEAMDWDAVAGADDHAPRSSPAAESLVAYDELGAGEGQIVGLSEGREATMPFYPQRVPIDAYCAAIIDTLDVRDTTR